MHLEGMFFVKHRRPNGKVSKHIAHNSAVIEGLNKLLDVMFRGVTPITSWFCGLIDEDGFTALASGDTAASHAGWDEVVEYDESLRQQWSPDSASGGEITNGTDMQFTMNAVKTIKGLFIASVSTKNSSTGILWATALFDDPIDVEIGSILSFPYTLTAEGA